MKAVTIRGVDADVAEKLKAYAKAQGKSINQVILDILKTGDQHFQLVSRARTFSGLIWVSSQ